MPTPEWLAEQFEQHRTHLRAVAYRMLGSASEADDAVQEGWIRLGRTDVSGVENLRAWLTTVVARVCLDLLRTRTSRREDSLDENVEHATHLPDPVITRADGDPESDAMLADSVGLALLVVLETLEPAERLAFVLHDVFGLPFDSIAETVGRPVGTCRQLARRARGKFTGAQPRLSEVASAEHQLVTEKFITACANGDIAALTAHPGPARRYQDATQPR